MLADDARLAWRFALAAQAKYRWRLLVCSLMVFIGANIAFASVAVVDGFRHIDQVAEARSWEFPGEVNRPARADVAWDLFTLHRKDIEVLRVAPRRDAASIDVPGLETLPPRGEYAVSPALSEFISEHEGMADLLPVSSVLSPAGVATGEEMYAVQRVDREELGRGVAVAGFGEGLRQQPASTADVPLWAPAAGVFLLVGLPAILLVAASAWIASAVREHRLSLLQRLGARRRGRRIAALETFVLTAPGMLAALLAWWTLIGRADTVPFIGSRLLDDAWLSAPGGSLLAAAVCMAVLVLATLRLSRPAKGKPTVSAGERTSSARWVPLGIGVLLLLVTPWLSVARRSDVFLAGVAVSALGVVLVLPRVTRAWGAALRRRESSPAFFLVGARLHRFPKRSARGWAPLAAACAVFAPTLVMVNLQAAGDTDVTTTAPSLTAYQVRYDGGDGQLQTLRRALDGHYVGDFRRSRALTLSGSCARMAGDLGFSDCSSLRDELKTTLGRYGRVTFDPDIPSSRKTVLVIGAKGADTLGRLGPVASRLGVSKVDDVTERPMRASPLVPWLLAGIGTGMILVLLALLVIVVDRSMTARQASTLGRIGLSVPRRRLVDAVAFVSTYVAAASLGLCLGVLSAVQLARVDFSTYFPWQSLALVVVGLVAVGLAGGTAVAVGSTRANGISVDSHAGNKG